MHVDETRGAFDRAVDLVRISSGGNVEADFEHGVLRQRFALLDRSGRAEIFENRSGAEILHLGRRGLSDGQQRQQGNEKGFVHFHSVSF